MAVASVFLLHFGSNTGYAIAPLERLFYEAGLELAGGDARLVHFGYPDYANGYPRNLPETLTNYITFNFRDTRPANIRYLSEYVRANKVRLVVIFDIQPVGPLFRSLHAAGAEAVIAYMGATISGRMPLWKLALKKLEVALSRSKVDGLIFESQAMADLALHGRGVPDSIIDVIPLGVDIDVFKPQLSDYVYQALEFPRDRKVVVYSGHMEPRKGVRVLVEAAIELLVQRRRSDVCFLLCGNKDDESTPFERMYAGLGIDKLIRFGGYRTDLPAVFPSCYCGVIPSTGWDSFTYSSIEMAASGLPVVASRLQGLSESVLDRHTGLLFEPGNARELADCIEMLLDNPETAARYGQEGRRRCENELNSETHRQRFVSVLRKRLGLQFKDSAGASD
jgi:glycosyltransferase involved in cell wall biosynthesis